MKKLLVVLAVLASSIVVGQDDISEQIRIKDSILEQIRIQDSIFETLPSPGNYADSLIIIEDFNNQAFQQAMLHYLNLERIRHGLDTVRLDEKLASDCVEISVWMANRDKLEHCKDFINYGGGYEIAMNNVINTRFKLTYAQYAYNAIHAWYRSTPHKAILHKPRITKIGVGQSRSKTEYNYIVLRAG